MSARSPTLYSHDKLVHRYNIIHLSCRQAYISHPRLSLWKSNNPGQKPRLWSQMGTQNRPPILASSLYYRHCREQTPIVPEYGDQFQVGVRQDRRLARWLARKMYSKSALLVRTVESSIVMILGRNTDHRKRINGRCKLNQRNQKDKKEAHDLDNRRWWSLPSIDRWTITVRMERLQ